MANRARAHSLATVRVLELVDAVSRIRFDYEYRFAEHEHELREVPDPYYGGAAGFERVLDLVEDASRGLLEKLRAP